MKSTATSVRDKRILQIDGNRDTFSLLGDYQLLIIASPDSSFFVNRYKAYHFDIYPGSLEYNDISQTSDLVMQVYRAFTAPYLSPGFALKSQYSDYRRRLRRLRSA